MAGAGFIIRGAGADSRYQGRLEKEKLFGAGRLSTLGLLSAGSRHIVARCPPCAEDAGAPECGVVVRGAGT